MRAVALALALLSIVFAGCISDDTPDDPSVETTADGRLEPTFANIQPDVVTAFETLSQLTFNGSSYPSSGGIWALGDYVYGSGLGAGFYIADVSDPENPVLLYDADEESDTPFARDADVVTHPDGRITLVLATQFNGLSLWDVTDPTAPTLFTILTDIDPNHNVAVVPGTEYVFNSPSGGLGRTNELVDASDPANAAVVGSFGEYGCHDITFLGQHGDDKFRAYCAGIDRTEIWDLTGFDATATGLGIEILGIIEVTEGNSPVVGNPLFSSYPLRTLHHLAMPNADGTVLIVGDEQNGGGSPGGCLAHTDQASSPTGALWFYDISDETAPELLSWLSPPLVEPVPRTPSPDNPTAAPNAILSSIPSCTAHFGTLIPGEEKLAMAWYNAGVLLIDFSDPAAPMILDQVIQPGSNVWDARVHNGYVFTGDISRGMDVLKLA